MSDPSAYPPYPGTTPPPEPAPDAVPPPAGIPEPGHPTPWSSPAPGNAADTRPPGRRGRQGARIAGVVAVAAMAAAVGGVVGRAEAPTAQTAATPSTLAEPVPAAGDLPQSPITAVAHKVLPSVVQLSGSTGEGSGVVLSADGLILTNAHVLEAGARGGLTATFQDGTTAPVQVVGRDTRADVAVVRAQGAEKLTPIQLGNSDGLDVGQEVVAVGSPLGLSGTVTSGIVSALNRPVVTQQPRQAQQPAPGDLGGLDLGELGGLGGLEDAQPRQPDQISALDAIQTDAAINPGNSGGPLVDMRGRIVGLNSAIASLGGSSDQQSGSIGVGFAIPINQVKRIADELIADGHAQQAQLGVAVETLAPNGARIVSVVPRSAAADAGLQVGDVITKAGTQLVQDSDALVAAINSAPPKSTTTLTVSRGAGSPHPVTVTLGSVDAS